MDLRLPGRPPSILASPGQGVRRPPKGWRRNMGTAALLLCLLIVIIVLPSPTVPRLIFAGVVVAVVLGAIAAIWKRNLGLERAAS